MLRSLSKSSFFLASLLSLSLPTSTQALEKYWNNLSFINGVAHKIEIVENDSVITNIKVKLDNINQPALFDICVNLGHPDDPSYPISIGGYSEIFCWTVSRHASQEPYQANLNLIDTPLFVPKGSQLYCASSSGAQNLPTYLSCEITLKNYEVGQPRYRSLRFPYTDMASLPDGSLSTSYYLSSELLPLNVKKVGIFQSFGGDTSSSHATGCLKWVRQGGTIVKEACFAPIVIDPTHNYETPPPLSIDWQIPIGDLLTATCQNTRSNTDCGIWAIVKIPDHLSLTRDNTFADYNNIPRDYLNNWCTQNYEAIKIVFCRHQPTCDPTLVHNKCLALFPPANCLSNQSCSATKPGDLNGDGSVNLLDFNLLILKFKNPYTIFNFSQIVTNFGR